MYFKFFIFIYIVVCLVIFCWLGAKASEEESSDKMKGGDLFKMLIATLLYGFFISAIVAAILYPIFAGVFGMDF